MFFAVEKKSEVDRLKKLVYTLIILVVILGCVAIAGLAVSVSNLKNSTDQAAEPRMENRISNACSPGSCANNATCLNSADVEDGYICICPYLYYGSRCEYGNTCFIAGSFRVSLFIDSGCP